MQKDNRKLPQIHVDIRVVLDFPNDIDEDVHCGRRQVVSVEEGPVHVALPEVWCHAALGR